MKNQTSSSSPVRVRFAPSPTGHLHLGGLRTALFNWLFARHRQGAFLVRIEDTDEQRSTKEFETSLLQSLQWAGIHSDEPLVYQSNRLGVYQAIAQQLLQEGKAYRCFCTEEELHKKRERSVQHQATYQYDKTCRNLKPEQIYVDKPYVIRFKIECATKDFEFQDHIKGSVVIPTEQIDDFVLLRTDGTVTYNFAVVVDDHEMKISHIIRGEEHLFNTPKQILLYQALGHQAPEFAHIPLILGPSGQKLSKRDGATSVVEYKKEGYLPQAFNNYLVRLGWAHGDQEIFTTDEMIQYFSIGAIHKSGAKFDLDKLRWINSHYLKQLSVADILSKFATELEKDFPKDTQHWTQAQREAWIALYVDRVATLKELYDALVKMYCMPTLYDWDSLRKLITKDLVIMLQQLQQELSHFEFEKIKLSEKMKAFCKTYDYKMAEISQLIRFVLTGSLSGPSVLDMLVLLGAPEVQKRISVVLEEL